MVEKFIGDAVMGVFGAPFAHGDDAERAVRAALVIRDCVGELAGGDLQIRVAVNTGEAVVSLGARPALASHGRGDVVNTAARLQAAARSTACVVGEEAYRETRDAIEYEPAEPVVAKGKEHPVRPGRGEPRTKAGERPLAIVDDRGPRGRDRDLARGPGSRDAQALPHLVSIFGRGRQDDDWAASAGPWRRRGGAHRSRQLLPYRGAAPTARWRSSSSSSPASSRATRAEVVVAKLREGTSG